MSDDLLTRFQSAFSSSQDSDVKLLKARESRAASIRDGDLPTSRELLCAQPFCRGDIKFDVRLWAKNEALKPYVADRPGLSEQLDDVIENPTRFTVAAIDIESLSFSEHNRRALYLAMWGDEAARWEIVGQLLSERHFNWLDGVYGAALALAITGMSPVDDNEEATPYNDASTVGLPRLRQIKIDRLDAALKALSEQSAPENVAGELDDFGLPPLPASGESPDDDLGDNIAEGPTAIVVPLLPDAPVAGGRDRKNNRESFRNFAGKALPLVTRGDVAAHRTALITRSPHLQPVIDTLLGDLATRDVVRFRPTILVGAPGVGKSAIARDICKQIGLPATVYGAGGVADGSFGGTSAQWSTSGPSVPLLLIRDAEIANPCVIVDEIDKAGTGHNNGNLCDALLGFLDPGNAAALRDPSLEMTVDLSHVNWLLTANSLEGIPMPLRDRCRILQVPNPDWQHIGDLARSIISDIARERDLDEGWIQPLAGDELDIVKNAWAGGSIRRLRRVIETLVDGREQLMARC